MKGEIEKVINMVEEGKISSTEASELIAALKDEPQQTEKTDENYLGKMLKIRVTSGTEENIRVNIPIRLVRFLLRMGHGIASHIPEAKKYSEEINVDLIMEAIDNELEGKIVDIQSDEGEKVEVYIE